jgi:hypothetical protein
VGQRADVFTQVKSRLRPDTELLGRDHLWSAGRASSARSDRTRLPGFPRLGAGPRRVSHAALGGENVLAEFRLLLDQHASFRVRDANHRGDRAREHHSSPPSACPPSGPGFPRVTRRARASPWCQSPQGVTRIRVALGASAVPVRRVCGDHGRGRPGVTISGRSPGSHPSAPGDRSSHWWRFGAGGEGIAAVPLVHGLAISR